VNRLGWRGRLLTVGLLVAGTGHASAQVAQPIGIFAADVRVVFPNYPQDVGVAGELAVDPLSLPGRGLGVLVGGHVYPLRAGLVTFGVGAEWLRSRGRDHVPVADDPDAEGPAIETRFSSFSPQVSFNFGSRQGWSYLTAGLGTGRLATELVDTPFGDPETVKVLNYGGGARWFAREHLALSLDLRFYSVSGQAATVTRPAYPKARLLVMSAGVSFK
jgi:hypothetical protein